MTTNRILRLLASLTLAAAGWTSLARAEAVDFEDLTLAPESHVNGYDANPYPADNLGEEHPFASRGVSFYNYYIDGWTSDWGGYTYSYWEGWCYSNETDTTTPGFDSQSSAIGGGGVAGSSNYAMAYLPETPNPTADVFRRVDVGLAYSDTPDRYGVYVTNTTYDFFSLRDGDQFSRKFGHTWDADSQTWVDTNEPDWFKLIVTGLDGNGTPVAGLAPVEFYLADFRNVEGAPDYIVDDWAWMDLASLVEGGTQQLQFVLDSSDKGAYGINTPLYVCIDAVPEPSTWAMVFVATVIGLVWWWRGGA